MVYKVCILSAGAGKRVSQLSSSINKALLPINHKPVLSHIIDKFDSNIEFVIAIGHKGHQIKEYISHAHPNLKVKFVNVDKTAGPGSGPGYSLLLCEKFLKCPFIFSTSDTLVVENVPKPNENWFGVAPISPKRDTENYCTVKIDKNFITQIDDKTKNDNNFLFTGLAAVKDYKIFFSNLKYNQGHIQNEIQVSNGFKGLLNKGLKSIGFTWYDTGSYENYKFTSEVYSDEPFDFSKSNEFIFFKDKKVIKYFDDKDILKNRFNRSKKLKGLVPKINKVSENFYSYNKIEGNVLYEVLSEKKLKDFLIWLNKNLWKKINGVSKKKFQHLCHDFYYKKTFQRINSFRNKSKIIDQEFIINEIKHKKLSYYLGLIDWNLLCEGVPVRFHGDLQFDNIIFNKNKTKPFTLIDWRHAFSSNIDYGDIYYDLAKLYGGIIISYKNIKKGLFKFDISGNEIYYSYSLENNLIETKEIFENFLIKKNYDIKKVKILAGLIFLNMSPLHSYPFDHFLYFFGTSYLRKILTE